MATQEDKDAGQRVMALREARGWSREELAFRAKVSHKTVGRIETGQVSGRRVTIRSIAEALEVDEVDILGERPNSLGLRLTDQMDGGFDEFRDHVANLNTQLAAIRDELQTASDERHDLRDQIKRVNELIERQSTVLANIEKVVAVLSDAEVIERSAAAAVRSLPEWPAPPPIPPPAVQEEQQGTGTSGRVRSRGPRQRRKPSGR